MTDVRRIAAIACFMLVTLRLVIGWQLLYEGLWKIDTLKSPTPWTAAGYLKNSQGPFRDFFRKLAGDADDLSWITAVEFPGQKPEAKNKRYWVPGVEQRWDAWQKRFEKHYRLSDRQKSRLNTWLNGSKTFEVELAELPAEVDLKALRLTSVVNYNTEKKRLVVDGVRHMMPEHRVKLEKVFDSDLDGVPDSVDIDFTHSTGGKDSDLDGIDDVADVDSSGGQDQNKNGIDDQNEADKHLVYLDAVKAAFKKSKDGLSFKEKLRATVAGNPEWTSSEELQRVGEIQKYRTMLTAYEKELAGAQQDFQYDHLQHAWGKIQEQKSSLVGPVRALDQELKDKAQEMLSVDQMKLGPVGKPWTSLHISDMMTIGGLTILGAMLIFGFCTRFAAIMAAVMLFMFYLAMPPWPGVPEAPGPEHSFIVNKNFIEVIALIAIATLPTGRWFGVDGMLGFLFGRRSATKEKASS